MMVSDYSLTSCFQDMFDPHGWSEDSYYEALGNVTSISFLFICSSTHLSVHPVSDLGDISGCLCLALSTGLLVTWPWTRHSEDRWLDQ